MTVLSSQSVSERHDEPGGTVEGLPPGLEIRNLHKAFHGVPAVTDLSMRIDVGEFVTLLGPSGSGKTTCLNMVAGFLLPDSGHIFIGGQDLSHVPPERRGLGIVFQSYALFPHMSVYENIAFPLKRRGIRGEQLKRKVAKALDDVELQARASAKPRELSGGQQQRVALARALVFEPSLILFDEPLGALDRRLRERLQVQLREMHERLRFTALYVTHDQEEALNLSDRIGIMNMTKLAQIGTCMNIYRRPRSAFVAKFLGDANMLDVTLGDCGENTCGITIDDSGVVLPALPSQELAATKGGKALLVARPESLNVTQPGTSGEHLLVRGILQSRTFLGQDLVSTVRTDKGLVITVRERPEGVVSQMVVGEPAEVMWRTRDSAIVVPPESTDQEGV